MPYYKEYSKRYYREHQKEILAYQKEYREKNPEGNKNWRKQNKERFRQYMKEYYKKVKGKRKTKRVEHRTKLLKLIGNKCYLCNSTSQLQFHEIHGKKHPRNFESLSYIHYVMKHKEDFVTLCRKCHFAIHKIAKLLTRKNSAKVIELIRKLERKKWD